MNDNYMSKALQGSLFEKFRSCIMGHGYALTQNGGNMSALEELRYYKSSERSAQALPTSSTGVNVTSNIE